MGEVSMHGRAIVFSDAPHIILGFLHLPSRHMQPCDLIQSLSPCYPALLPPRRMPPDDSCKPPPLPHSAPLQLCDLFEVLLRLGPPYAQSPLATRLAQQTEARNSRGQLRVAHKLAAAWGLYGLASATGGGPVGAYALAERLREEAPRSARAEGAEGLCGCFRRMSTIPVGRVPVLEGVAAEVEHLPVLDPQTLTDMFDALARLRCALEGVEKREEIGAGLGQVRLARDERGGEKGRWRAYPRWTRRLRRTCLMR